MPGLPPTTAAPPLRLPKYHEVAGGHLVPGSGETKPGTPGSPVMQPSTHYGAVHVPVLAAQGTPTFDRHPTLVYCPYCYHRTTTVVEQRAGAFAYLLFWMLFVLGFFLLLPWCFCWLPLVLEGCLDSTHRCRNCDNVLGVHKVLS